MRSLLAVIILLWMIGLPSVAQHASADSDQSARVQSLENMWNQAETKHDVQAMRILLADSFRYTDDDGSFMDRSHWLARVGKGTDQYEMLGYTGMRVDLYDHAAVVTGEYRERIKEKGKIMVHSGRFTDTWVQQNDQWKCVASQSTLINP